MNKLVFFTALSLIYISSFNLYASSIDQLLSRAWYSGSLQCKTEKSNTIEVYQYDNDSYILRQNKCQHYEAPFIYLLFGSKKALIIDTGATEDATAFPLAKAITEIVSKRAVSMQLVNKSMPLIVAHSHSHSDHIAGDEQFRGVANIDIIEPNNLLALTSRLKITDWPNQLSEIDLGNRLINIIPSPGHQKEAIAFYDNKNKWLLTGDTIYPGRLYIRKWLDYKKTIKRLITFSKSHEISAIVGAHIEMSKTPNKDYAMGSTFQPNEASLVLTISDLQRLDAKLDQLGDIPTKVPLGNMIIFPVK